MIKYLFILLILLHLFILSQLQFTAWPEMFSYAYLFNNGFYLYRDFALPYQPFLVVLLSYIYKVFGYHLGTLEIFTWLVIIINDLLIYYLSIKFLKNKFIRLIPLLVYVFLQPLFEGNQLWFDLASTPFLLLGLVGFNFFKENSYKYFCLGLFLALAFFIKQQQGIVIAFVSLLILSQRNWKNFLYYGLGGIIPTIIVLISVLFSHVFSDFWFWTVEVPILWYPNMPGYATLPTFRESIQMFLIFGPVVLFSVPILFKKDIFPKLVLIFFISTFVVAFPRFALFRLQPALAIYVILLIIYLEKINQLKILLLLPIFLVTIGLFKINSDLFNKEARFYGLPETKFVLEKNKITSENTIFLLGPHSLNYVISNTLPPKPWVDNFNWYMEIPGIQQQVISGLERQKPKVIFRSTPYNGQWYELGSYQPKNVVRYIQDNYLLSNKINGDIEVWVRKN